MGNVILEDSQNVKSWLNRTPLLLTIHVKSIFRVQAQRSYFLQLVLREDIWDSKNAFHNEVYKIIIEQNLKSNDIKELVDLVVDNTKELIKREK